MAGLACSSFFPLSFSLAQGRFPSAAQMVSGSLMATYMLGYGFASYGIGWIVQECGMSLETLYRFSVFIPLIMVFLSVVLTPAKSAVLKKE